MGISAEREEPTDPLLEIVYDELRALASSYLRNERPAHTLQTTALVHEAWLRASTHGFCQSPAADMNLDGLVDGADIKSFVVCLLGGPCP